MSITEALETIVGYAGLGFPDFILVLIVLVSIIFSMQDHKIGLIACLLMTLMAFVFFVLNGIEATRALILFFVTLILMAFSVYTSRQDGGLF